MRNVSDKSSREKQATHFRLNNFYSKIVPFMDNVGKTVEPGSLQVTKWGMRIACRMPKATNTHSQYVIRIAFPL